MAKTVKFEEQIKELESIINELESGEVDLDTSSGTNRSPCYISTCGRCCRVRR